MTLFAELTAADFGSRRQTPGDYAAERDRIWALCELVIAECHAPCRSDMAIRTWMMEMETIHKRATWRRRWRERQLEKRRA